MPTLGLVCFLRYKVVYLWFFFFFNVGTINFPLCTALSSFHKYVFVCLKIFSNFSVYFWPIGCSVVYCLISTYLWIFQFSFWHWFLVSFTVVRKYTSYDLHLLKFLKRLVSWPNTWSVLENIPCVLDKNISCYYWVKWSI